MPSLDNLRAGGNCAELAGYGVFLGISAGVCYAIMVRRYPLDLSHTLVVAFKHFRWCSDIDTRCLGQLELSHELNSEMRLTLPSLSLLRMPSD